MKSNELRTGNWVKNIVGQKIQITRITENTGNNLEPIPLTEEWLLRFGFVKDNMRFIKTYRLSFLDLFYSQGHVKVGSIMIEVKYVHSLQNLFFALTGEELKIDSDE